MNPFLNPLITIPFFKEQILNPGRIENSNPKQLEHFRDKAFKKMVSYAYTVPLYKKKYKEANIHPSDIKGIKDISKLPFVSRLDFRESFPDGVIPQTFDKKEGYVICTGGTTGKYCCNSGSEPICIYTDFPTLLRGLGITLREQRVFNFNWRKTRFAHLGNFNPFKFDEIFEKNVQYHMKTFFSFDNHLTMNASDPIDQIIKKLDDFKPDVITSYPALFQEIAYLKRKGYGTNIRPKLLNVGGDMLDDYTRRYVEDAFGCRMLNSYGSCEAGANIAFECMNGSWHIHSDFFHVEAINENNEIVAPGERGHIVLTRLFGGATPIIRYTGMKDWITLSSNGKQCSCGLHSPIFEKYVEGRVMSNIILPNGKVYSPSSFLFITSVLCSMKTYKVKKFQIVQKKIDEIEILFVIDDDLRHSGPSVDEIIKRIEKVYIDEVGSDVTITIKEVDEIPDDPITGKPAPLVISQILFKNECKLDN